MNERCLSILLLLITLTVVRADDTLVKFPDGDAAWIVSITKSQSNSSAALPNISISKIAVTQNKDYRRDIVTYNNGKSEEVWEINELKALAREVDGDAWVALPDRFFSVPFTPDAFSWLSSSLLTGTDPVDYQGKQCFHYKGTASLASGTGQMSFHASCEAWVDAKTLLPVALDDGSSLAVYTFSPPPTMPLVMPLKFLKAVNYFKVASGIPVKGPLP